MLKPTSSGSFRFCVAALLRASPEGAAHPVSKGEPRQPLEEAHFCHDPTLLARTACGHRRGQEHGCLCFTTSSHYHSRLIQHPHHCRSCANTSVSVPLHSLLTCKPEILQAGEGNPALSSGESQLRLRGANSLSMCFTLGCSKSPQRKLEVTFDEVRRQGLSAKRKEDDILCLCSQQMCSVSLTGQHVTIQIINISIHIHII